MGWWPPRIKGAAAAAALAAAAVGAGGQNLATQQPSYVVLGSVTIITSTSTQHITVTFGAPSSSLATGDGQGTTSVQLPDGGGGSTQTPSGGEGSSPVGSDSLGLGPVGSTSVWSASVESASIGLTSGIGPNAISSTSIEPTSIIYDSKHSTQNPTDSKRLTSSSFESSSSNPFGSTNSRSASIESASIESASIGLTSSIGPDAIGSTSIQPASIIFGSKGSTRVPTDSERSTSIGSDFSGSNPSGSTSVGSVPFDFPSTGLTATGLTSAIGSKSMGSITIGLTSTKYTSAGYASIEFASVTSGSKESTARTSLEASSDSQAEGERPTPILTSHGDTTEHPSRSEDSASTSSADSGHTSIGSATILVSSEGSTSAVTINTPGGSQARSGISAPPHSATLVPVDGSGSAPISLMTALPDSKGSTSVNAITVPSLAPSEGEKTLPSLSGSRPQVSTYGSASPSISPATIQTGRMGSTSTFDLRRSSISSTKGKGTVPSFTGSSTQVPTGIKTSTFLGSATIPTNSKSSTPIDFSTIPKTSEGSATKQSGGHSSTPIELTSTAGDGTAPMHSATRTSFVATNSDGPAPIGFTTIPTSSKVSTPSGSATISGINSASSTIPTDKAVLIFVVQAGVGSSIPSSPPGLKRRRARSGSFIGDTDARSPSDCSQAMQFYIVNGELVSGGEIVSANIGDDHVPLSVSPTRGSITTTWGFLDGELLWANGNFTGGRAGFCRGMDGEVYATFKEGDAYWHAGCEDVRLLAVLASTCPGLSPDPDGGLLPANATLILPQSVYFPSAAPTDEFCVPVTESWVIGQFTVIPSTNISSGSS